MTTDPIAGLTLAPYSYVDDNPLNFNDPTGLIFGIPGTPSTSEIAGTVGSVAQGAASGVVNAVNTAGRAVDSVAHYAAPAVDIGTAGACIVFTAACG